MVWHWFRLCACQAGGREARCPAWRGCVTSQAVRPADGRVPTMLHNVHRAPSAVGRSAFISPSPSPSTRPASGQPALMSSVEGDWFPTHLRVTVIGARNLRAKRKKGLSDCYTVIRLGPEKYMTSVKGGTLNPEWKEECTLPLPPVLDNSNRWTLHLTVKHSSARFPLDHFLGHVAVPVGALYGSTSRRRNQWYDLQSKPNKPVKDRGQIQLAFQFLRDNMTASAYELSKERPQSVFDKFKDKVASLKYGMTHEILPTEGPSSSMKHHRSSRMSKSHSYGE
ncbi:rab11 family-interacting protein 2-like isoform X2 [Narcine bancroftii]|uniref:rab11 family-interacting protein 2-like isoform X2 n=1 Tax=Narcine bancroftii TaxID=1343680 RepID=UPI0038321159